MQYRAAGGSLTHPRLRRVAWLGTLAAVCAGCTFDSTALPGAGSIQRAAVADPTPSRDAGTLQPDFANGSPSTPATGAAQRAADGARATLEAGSGSPLSDAARVLPAEAGQALNDVLDAGVPARANDGEDAGARSARADGGDAGAQAAAPGTLFGACASSDRCQAGFVCTHDLGFATGASGMGYCTAACGGLSATGACPQPATGMTEAICSGALCILGSCERSTCPVGMSCQQTASGLPTQFECEP